MRSFFSKNSNTVTAVHWCETCPRGSKYFFLLFYFADSGSHTKLAQFLDFLNDGDDALTGGLSHADLHRVEDPVPWTPCPETGMASGGPCSWK